MFCCFGAKSKSNVYNLKLINQILSTDNLEKFKKVKYPRYFVVRMKNGTVERRSILILAAKRGAIKIVTYLAMQGYINDTSTITDEGITFDEESIVDYVSTYPALISVCNHYNINYMASLFNNNFIWAFKLPYERVKEITNNYISIQGIHRAMYYMSEFPQHTTLIFTDYILDRLSGKCLSSDINIFSRCILEFQDPHLFNLIRKHPHIYKFVCNALSRYNADRMNEIQNKYTAGLKFRGFTDITIILNS